jgi:hypothetical protein
MDSSPYKALPVKGRGRLMVLLPGDTTAPLQYILKPFDLDDPPLYDALSYTWEMAFHAEYKHKIVPATSEALLRGNAGPSLSTRRNCHSRSMQLQDLQDKQINLWKSSNKVIHLGDVSPYTTSMPRQHQPFGTRNQDSYIHPEIREKTEGGSFNGYITIGQSKVRVQENLDRALYRLRRPDLERTLWVDAICIDQENGIERGHQVSQMGRIFQLASTVYVWLGEAAHNSNQAMRFIGDLWRVKTINGISQDD